MPDYETLEPSGGGWWRVSDGLRHHRRQAGHGVIMLPFFVGRTDTERRIAINTVGPHWDGRQSGGRHVWRRHLRRLAGGLRGCLLGLLHGAMLLVLFALFFRPVGFDYRSKIDNPTWRNAWGLGPFLAAIPALIRAAFGTCCRRAVPARRAAPSTRLAHRAAAASTLSRCSPGDRLAMLVCRPRRRVVVNCVRLLAIVETRARAVVIRLCRW